MCLPTGASLFWRSGAFVSLIGIILVACLMQLPNSAASVVHGTQEQQQNGQQQQQRLGNMLRDAVYNKNAPNDQVLSDNDVATVDELDADNYVGDDFANDFAAASERYAASDESSSVELLRFVDERDDAMLIHATTTGAASTTTTSPTTTTKTTTTTAAPTHEQSAATLPLAEQVQLLSKQLNALMMRRREDYELLEHNLRKSLRIGTTAKDALSAAAGDADMRTELQDLRREVAALRDGHLGGNKERLTVEWLQQSIAEIRKQLVELQGLASEASKSISHRTQSYEDMATVRNDFTQLKLEVAALRERQQQNEVFIQELREEALQQEEDYKRLLLRAAPTSAPTVVKGTPTSVLGAEQTQQLQQTAQSSEIDSENNELINDPLTADHKRRHCRFQRQQIHELQLAQHSLKSQLNELKYHRIGERVRNLEIEQHRMADANFNLSRQIASLDKLHTSMLELLEDVESLQTKMDKSLPELRHEISKLEFTSAQLTAEQSLLREEGKNVARSVQAMAVSVSTLQDERDANKQMQVAVAQLRGKLDRLESVSQDMQRAVMQQQKQHSMEHKLHHSHQKHHNHQHRETSNNKNNNDDNNNIAAATAEAHGAESLVAKLENVEEQYESIIQNLPQDCSEAPTGSDAGLFMISPAGQQRPRMVHCSADGWTTIQRRYDGSADFNRSWADYAAGFGQPAGEYWIGNEQLHHLTRNNCTQLRILMQDIYDNVWLAQYDRFYISSRADGYRLNTAGYSGNASDALDYQQGMQFSAIDVDRDISQTHCAANYEGGWWFSHCQHANLNGRYNLGLTWFDAARNEWIAVKISQMLIKRQPAAKCSAALTAAEATMTTTWHTASVATSPTSSSSSSPSLPAAPAAGQHELTDSARSEAMPVAAVLPAAANSATHRPVRSPATIAMYASAARL
ncbi:protein scabrous [Zeugodacus cucurbitae]|uniref:protein scabrous n=1 Tax=Zeugodacus cucurbitae TaxID=28588 RepID=UPI0010A742EA|nr:protein scabrous [Zeugodacus cucurbitae]